MLERFKVKDDHAVRVGPEPLRETVAGVFQKMDVPAEDARLAADVLVTADLRGVDSHGVSNMLRSYVNGYNRGEINPRPRWSVVRQTPAAATVDSDRGLGIIIAPKAMELAMDKADDTGIGMVTISNGRHLGMASYHAMMALQRDMIGTCMTSAPPRMVPTFGAEPRLGTNPIAVAAPAKEEPPFVYDAATTVVAQNKIVLARRLEAMIPSGWLAAPDGTPILDESDGSADGGLLPVGSTREAGSHKGYGLACVVDIMCGLLSDGSFGMFPGRPNFNHMVSAYKIEAFTDTNEFKEAMDRFLRTLRETPTAPSADRVLFPGLAEAEAERDRQANGIPLHDEVVTWIRDLCGELGVVCRL